MAIFIAETTVAGEQKQFIAGPFDTSADAAESGEAGFLFQVTGEETPILLPVFLRKREEKIAARASVGLGLSPE